MADIDRISGSFQIDYSDEYAVLSGSCLYIFRTDGSLVARRKDLRNAGRITFLSNHRMLLCSSKAVFHMIDLRDGSDIWTVPYTKIELNTANLAVSPDETFAYTWDQWKGAHFISRLDLQTCDLAMYDMYMDAGATMDLICDDDGIPCLLKTLRETIGGNVFQQNGVRLHDFDGITPGNTTVWKSKWSFEGARSALRFFGDTNAIVTNDLHVFEPSSGTSFDLLENETTWKHPEGFPVDCRMDLTKRYLCVQYRTVHVIIDIVVRKVAAQYAAGDARGCMVGSEYWICVNNRLCRKPFPAFEDAPATAFSVNSDWYQ